MRKVSKANGPSRLKSPQPEAKAGLTLFQGNYTEISHKGHREMPESSDRVPDRKRDQKAHEKEARASQKFQQDPDSFKHSHRPSYPSTETTIRGGTMTSNTNAPQRR